MSSLFQRVRFTASFSDIDSCTLEIDQSIAFSGKSNSGKSSLINALCNNKKLARTSNAPGRTQQLVFFHFLQNNYFIDLPGYGYAKVSKQMRRQWGTMMDDFFYSQTLPKALPSTATAYSPPLKGLILVNDCRRELSEQDWQLLHYCHQKNLDIHLYLSKADKLSKSQQQPVIQKQRNIILKKFGHTSEHQPTENHPTPQISISMGSCSKKYGLEPISEWILDKLRIN